MIDAFYIFTKGGLLLWSTQLVKVKGNPLDRLIKEVLLEERVGETFATFDSYNLKWKLMNEMDIFLVVVYQGILQLAYLEGLLAYAAKEFVHSIGSTFGNGLSIKHVDFDADFRKAQQKADKELKESKNVRTMRSFDQTKKGSGVLKNKEEKGITGPAKKKSGGAGEDDEEDEEGDDDGKGVAEARAKLAAKAKGVPAPFKKKEVVEEPPPDKAKKGKEARHWDGQKASKSAMQDSAVASSLWRRRSRHKQRELQGRSRRTYESVQNWLHTSARHAPSLGSSHVGKRSVGDVLRLVKQQDGFALLHPLELSRLARDYQDYWSAILSCELPRRSTEAWIAISSLEALQGSPDVFPISQEGPPEDSSASSLEQEWLRLGDSMQAVEKEEAFRLVARSLTVIVSTSPSPQHCDAQLLCEVLSSLQANEALRHCRKLLLFDAQPCAGHQEEAEKGGQLAAEGRSWVPSASSEGGEGAALAEACRCYQNELQTAAQRGDPAMQGVELIFLQEWGHLVGTVRRALDSLSTPFVLLHQHDLVLSREMSASLVVEALKALASRDANCILLNRDVNFAGRSTEYLQAALHRPELWRSFARQHRLSDPQSALVLTPFVGYSDQTQLARADWLRNRVLRMVGNLKCCMEFAVHEIMIR
ncbi:unnamed protein product, partial [Polarella glacialis]